MLNNNAVQNILNSAYLQIVGSAPVGGKQLDLSSFVDVGNDPTLPSFKEQFTKALVIGAVKNFFTDTSYKKEYNDPFFENSEEYGAITQMINIEVPDVQASHAWKEFENGTTVGTYEVFMPVVHTQYYGKTNSWELPITITYEQWNDAVKDYNGLSTLVSHVMMIVENKIYQHLEDCNGMNRNNFIAEKFAYAATPEAKGIHVINLCEVAGKQLKKSLTVDDFRNDAEALRIATAKISLFTKYLRKQSTQFNTAEYVRFTPSDRLVVQVLSEFESDVNRVLMSDTFHNDMVALPKYESIPYWQDSEGLTFDKVSSINVKTGTGTVISKKGIVAFICDKWAILHTIKKQRVASRNFDPEALDMYFYQFRDMYANNLTMNAVVFYLEDYTHTA